MAYTKIHAIKATVNKAVAYITNPAKTDEKLLVDSFGCTPETAEYEFNYELSKTLTNSPNKAYHLIQSFLPGEVSYDEAHKIGIELADKLLENKYSYVIATHIDHDHVHNHIIFCAADNLDHKKYDDNKRSYYHIRHLSDEICSSHNLSIIIPGAKKGMKYNEWMAKKDSSSWKDRLRTDIDDTIKNAQSYDNFIDLLKAKGYEIKGHELTEGSAKYIAFRPLESRQYIRGSARSLGSDYTKECIEKRIQEQVIKEKRKVAFPKKVPAKNSTILSQEELLKRKPKDPLKGPRTSLIDTSQDKFTSSKGLRRWANIQNLKAAAHAYALTGDMEKLEAQITEKEAIIKTAKQSLVSLEKKIKPAAEIIHYADIYMANLRYHNGLEKSKDPDRYYRDHDVQINLFNSAEHVLKDIYHINPSTMDYHHMNESFNLMKEKKAALTSTWKDTEKELTELKKQLETIKTYLGTENAESMQTHMHEANHKTDKTEAEKDLHNHKKDHQQRS